MSRGYRSEEDEEWEDIAIDRIKVETDEAVCFQVDGDDYWCPRRWILAVDKDEITMAAWKARELGLA